MLTGAQQQSARPRDQALTNASGAAAGPRRLARPAISSHFAQSRPFASPASPWADDDHAMATASERERRPRRRRMNEVDKTRADGK